MRRSFQIEALEDRRLLAFGVTTGVAPTGQPTYVIDNGGDLKFSVIRGGSLSNTLHLADVSSIQYKNREMLAPYSTTSRYSHYEQGLGSSTVITYTVNSAAGWILVKCDDSIASDGSATQYYAVRRGDNNLYMASLPTNVNGGPGEGRFIAYLSRSGFANPEEPSDNAGNTGAIEGGDVFGHADGTTSSKFYNVGGRRQVEHEYHGLVGNAAGQGVGAWMFMGSRERSAGGPFFKDIDFQSGSAVEIYNVIFSGHTQTEPYRQGLHTYALQFTDGSLPAAPDYAWFDNVKDAGGNPLIGGHVPAAQRGAIAGRATGSPAGQETVVALSNAEAQYWDMADASGNYSITGVLPGTYTETLYSNELAVGTRTVTVAAGQTTRADITSTYFRPAATWRIGTWDGTPVGFLNSDKIEVMHPSDVRMSPWTSMPNFVVGTHTDAQWPMTQFMGVNNGQRITFNLTAAQASQAQTLRIGITLGFEGGRNRVTVNAGQTYAWTSAIPSASRDLNSRGITRGTWRGDNQLYTYNLPTSALRAGTNTIDLPVVSGSYVAGQTWLSPNVVYDAVDLVPTSSLTNAPRVTTVAVTPANGSLGVNGTRQFTADARDQFGNVTPANVTWSAARGTIDDTGAYTAPATGGTDTVTATSGAVGGATGVSVLADAQDVAWYRADVSSGTTLPDSSGNNLTANLTGSYNFVPGVSGNAVRLTGGSAALPAGVVSSLDDFTVATWVKLDSLATWSRVFDFGTGTTAYMFLTPQAGGTNRPRFAITTSGGAGEQRIEGNTALTAGGWNHVAVTLAGGTGTLYLNGGVVGTNAAMTLTPASLGGTGLNYVGKSQYADPALQGSVDDFRIYGRALSPNEIAALGATPLPAWLASDGGATWDPATKVLAISGAASITADPGPDAPLVTANGSAAVLSIAPASATRVNLGGLSLTNGARVSVSPAGPTRVLVVGSGSGGGGANLGVDATSTLDLTDNAMVIRNPSSAAATASHTAVNGRVRNAFHDFAWDRPGITSSTVAADVADGVPATLGVLLNNDGGGNPLFYGDATASTGDLPPFHGVSVDANCVLLGYTRLGDGDLSGAVDSVDFALFQAGYTGASPFVGFAFGDYDYNGVIDSVDFGLFQTGYGA